MAKVVNFKKKLSYFLNLIDKRQECGDLWGVLDATRNAITYSKTKVEKDGLNLLMGQVYFDMGQYALSMEYFFRAVPVVHLRASAFFGVARNLVLIKKYDLALDYLEATIKWDFNGIFSGAVLEWTHQIKQNINSPAEEVATLIQSAKHFLLEKDYKNARLVLGSLKSDETTSSLLATLNLFEGDLKMAEAKSKEVLSTNPQHVDSICVLLEVYAKTKNEKLLNKMLYALFDVETEDVLDLRKIGLVFSKFKDFEKARKFFEKLAKIDEFNAKNHLFLALCNFNLAKTEEAMLELSKARWLDMENPLYGFFMDIIKTGETDFLEIKAKLPKEIENEKIKNLLEIFYGGVFEKEISKSFCLEQDILWSFSLDDFSLADYSSAALANSNNKKAKKILENIMLSPKLSARQKYVITKNAMLSNNHFLINFVCNFRFSSFKLGKNEICKIKNINIRNAVCSAVSFCECFFGCEMLANKIIKSSNKLFGLENFCENKLACFLLYNHPKIFASACHFFGVSEKEILGMKNITGEVKNE